MDTLPVTPMIRRATAADAAALLTLTRAFATSFPVEEAAFSASLAQLLTAADAFLTVAELDGSIAGYVLAFDHVALYAGGRVAWVEEIMVEAERRRSGIGAALMESTEAWARDRDCRLVALATRRAGPFYAALHYEESAIYYRKVL